MQASKDKLHSFVEGILATTILEAKGRESDDIIFFQPFLVLFVNVLSSTDTMI